jgi:hypothetical protein
VKKDDFSTKLNVMEFKVFINVLKKEPYIIGHATFENNGIKLGQAICYEQGPRTMIKTHLDGLCDFILFVAIGAQTL